MTSQPTDAAASPSTSSPPPMYSPSQMRQLKVAVVAMGIILLLGFALVIGRIVYLVNSGPRPTFAVAPLAQVPTEMSLPSGAAVRHLAFSGNRLAVYYDSPAGSGIRIIELTGGGPQLTVRVVTEPERRP